MKLLIVTTGNQFTPSMLYKENYIIKAAIENGDEVLVLASEYTYVGGKPLKVSSDENIEGYVVKRLRYKMIVNGLITRKVRVCRNYFDEVLRFGPDLIFFNCAQVYDINYCKKIKEALPDVKMVMDFSTKFINSARNWFSREILHKIIYRRWIQNALPYIDRVFYISVESKEFANDIYRIPLEMMEHNNLPGALIGKAEKDALKGKIYKKHGFSKETILFVHSGKIGRLKRTAELLRGFRTVEDDRFKLLIIGSLEEVVRTEIMELVSQDSRVEYLGFLSGAELTQYLCAADIYLQPGTISQTSQTAICCGCPIAFTSVPTNLELFNKNGFFIDADSEIVEMFRAISRDSSILKNMSDNSYELAEKELDYHTLYRKILLAVGL